MSRFMSRAIEAGAGAPAGQGTFIPVRHKTLLTLAVMAGMTMQILDSTIANVALPHIQAALGGTQETIGWVLTSYIISSAVVLPALGWLGAHFGTRKVFVVSVIVFTAASALCGLAQNIEQLVFFRVLQGLGGAFISPLAQTIMLDINPPEKRARAMGMFVQGIMLGPIAGPVLGGYLTENFDWRWVFYVNVPIGIAAVFVLLATMPVFPARGRRFDLFGWVAIAIAVAGLQLLLDRGASKDWFESTEILVWGALFLGAAWIFLVHMATNRDPLFPRELFRDRNFVVALGFSFLIGLVMLSVMALLPVLLQSIYGYPAIQAGWLLTPRGVGVLLTMSIVTRIGDRLDTRVLMAAGLAIAAWSLHMMAGWGPKMPMRLIIISGCIQGLGLGFAFTPINVLAFATLPSHLRTDAAGLVNLCRNLGASFGIAASSVLLARSIQVNHAEIAANLTREALPIDIDSMRRFNQLGDAGFAVLDGLVNQQAVMIGYINDFHAMSIACLAAIPLVAFMRRAKAPAGARAQA